MKTILITGINGFLGSHLAKNLSKNFNIIGLEYSLDNLDRIQNCGYKVYSSIENFENIFKENKIFAIIHAATLYRRNKSISIESLIQTNIMLPVKLYELAEKHSCTFFLNIDTFFNDPQHKYNYLSDYTLSKKQVIEWLKLTASKCKLVNMKIFHMYGENDAISKFISQMIHRLENNDKSIDLTSGDQKRDFIYIDDVVNAFSVILKNEKKIPSKFIEFQIGTGNSVSIKNLMIVLKKLTKSTSLLNFGKIPHIEGEIMDSKANNNDLLKLGWTNEFNLNKGLLRLIKQQ
jgi:nucleoside-diphosphate-sugar epimerase